MNHRWLERGIWLALAGVIGASLVLGARSLWRRDAASTALPIHATLPDFELTASNGAAVDRAGLTGQVWVADFIFTNCAGVCPVLSARMAEVQRTLAARDIDAKLISISVDPARDTPQKLSAYAERFAADPRRWWFLTGEREALYDLIGKGFKLSVAERSPEEAGAGGDLITHSDRFVLVDRRSRIRGYYHGTEPESVRALIEDVARLSASEG